MPQTAGKPQYNFWATLLDSYYNYQHEKWNTTAENIIDSLNKVRRPQSDAMLKGIAFEDCLQKAGVYSMHGFTFKQDVIDLIYREVQQSARQVFVEYFLEDVDCIYRLYGYIDFLKPRIAFDVKTKAQYEQWDFNANFQHKVYGLGLLQQGFEMKAFKYLVTDFESVAEEFHAIDSYAIESWKTSLLNQAREIKFFMQVKQQYIHNQKLITTV